MCVCAKAKIVQKQETRADQKQKAPHSDKSEMSSTGMLQQRERKNHSLHQIKDKGSTAIARRLFESEKSALSANRTAVAAPTTTITPITNTKLHIRYARV